MFSFAELSEVREMLSDLAGFYADANRIQQFRNALALSPARLSELQGFLENEIARRNWSWEERGEAVQILTANGSAYTSIAGPDSPRSTTHLLLNALLYALESEEGNTDE